MENIGINKIKPEERKKWREDHKDELNPQHKIVRMPDGTMEDLTKENEEELKEAVREEHNDLR